MTSGQHLILTRVRRDSTVQRGLRVARC
ncbi:unnamed protein product [Staurois parvus]|uniref:Uncharacterized protein n=1 Tax=Staurois parvus TaxID=386267 RepID=A0ABN9DEB5_9NEOB|nr:unnamed protein product [Staurois parvus]